MIVAGVDEAGRGPCFGPMVISIAVIDTSIENELKNIGVKDSKEILPKKRESLLLEIKEKTLEYQTLILEVKEINSLMVKHSLNEIEAMKIAELINNLDEEVEKIFVDSPDSIPKKFEERIRKYLNKDKQKIKIVSENKADSKYIVVGAASIIAKVTRDKEIEKISAKFGSIGSGYPSDPYTKKFLAEYVEKTGKLPPFSRIFWKTCEVALEKKGTIQQKLI